MLKSLTIKNIALISSAKILFTDGLNVLSGETGAGKSVIIESLNFVLGAKADKTLIKTGEIECFVKAEFEINDNESIIDIFNELDIEYDGNIIISRKFTIDGKSSIKVNGETVTVGMLRKFTSKLVDVHGQSEHFYLLKTQNQLDLIDRFGGDEISIVKTNLKRNYSVYKEIINKINNLGGDESNRALRLDILAYQINEIETFDLKEDEEQNLLDIKEKLKHQEKIINALSAVKSAISDEGGVSDVLSGSLRLLSSITGLSCGYSELHDRLTTVYSEIDDISDTASTLLDDFDYSSYDPDEIEDRLAAIKTFKKKYGNDYNSICEFLVSAKEEQANLENFNQLYGNLNVEKEKFEKLIYADYKTLNSLRNKFSKVFSSNVLSELKELGMNKAKFEVTVSDLCVIEDCNFNSQNGIDEVEFMFSANLGEPLKPLSAVISGGEMSRFMLSIKAQTARFNNVSTFIFDEIDAGISGNIAKIVAQKFAKISKCAQIIAISHLPQISAMADNNLLISKNERETFTETNVKILNESEKIDEITRLVGGEADSETAKLHAQELIFTANDYKNSIK